MSEARLLDYLDHIQQAALLAQMPAAHDSARAWSDRGIDD